MSVSKSDRTEEHDELLMEFRLAYEMSNAWHDRREEESNAWHDRRKEESGRHMGKVNDLEERIRALRARMGLPRVSSLHTLRTTKGEFVPSLDGSDLNDPTIRRFVRNDATAEIVYQVGQLQRAMPENAPDLAHIAQLHRALTDAATALQDALKPYAAPIV